MRKSVFIVVLKYEFGLVQEERKENLQRKFEQRQKQMEKQIQFQQQQLKQSQIQVEQWRRETPLFKKLEEEFKIKELDHQQLKGNQLSQVNRQVNFLKSKKTNNQSQSIDGLQSENYEKSHFYSLIEQEYYYQKCSNPKALNNQQLLIARHNLFEQYKIPIDQQIQAKRRREQELNDLIQELNIEPVIDKSYRCLMRHEKSYDYRTRPNNKLQHSKLKN